MHCARSLAALATGALLLSAAPAHADTTGLATSELGGQGGGAATLGAAGLPSNVAAGAMVKGGELALDLGLNIFGSTFERAPDPVTGERFDRVGFKKVMPAPSLALAWRPANGPVGLGLSVGVPFGRSSKFPEEGPQRYENISVSYMSIFATGSASLRIGKHVAIGVGASYVHTRMSRHQHMDMGLTVLRLDPDSDPPLEDPFLESDWTLTNASGHGIAGHAGLIVRPLRNLWFGAGFQSPVAVRITGDSVLQPSMALALESHADATLRWTLPPILNMGMRWRITPRLTVGLEGIWTGWSSVDYFHLSFANSELIGGNAELNALLAATGADSAASLLDTEKVIARKLRNTVSGRVLVEARPARILTIRGLVGFDHHAVPSDMVSIGSVDFDAISVGLGAELRVAKAVTLTLSSTQYIMLARTISDSAYSPYSDPDSGMAAAPGNGHYTAFLNRTALGVKVHFGGGGHKKGPRPASGDPAPPEAPASDGAPSPAPAPADS